MTNEDIEEWRAAFSKGGWKGNELAQLNALCDLAQRGLEAEWRPIEEAPKDGTHFFLAVWNGVRCHVGEAYAWENGFKGIELRWADGEDVLSTKHLGFQPLPQPPEVMP